ncbi:MAG: response regulator transcription factor [Verrucomicrobia bacterium]|nr:response regulator transcription factor [Verrucomicrobiota bacterium]
MPIRIALVEDDASVREGLILHLRRAQNLMLTAAYASAEEAMRGVASDLPDVILTDINLPGRSGIECVAALKAAHPQLQFLMLTVYDDSEQIFAALRAGASGYLLKRATPEELIAAIVEVREGGSPMSMQIARKVVSYFHEIAKPSGEVEKLTAREQVILSLLAKGSYYKEIAAELGISANTVRNHLHVIYGKLHVQSRTEAVLKYLSH